LSAECTSDSWRMPCEVRSIVATASARTSDAR